VPSLPNLAKEEKESTLIEGREGFHSAKRKKGRRKKKGITYR
jgi:ribosomal protein S6E (S10)